MQQEEIEGNYATSVVPKRQNELVLHDLILINLEKATTRVVSLRLLVKDEVSLDQLCLIDVFDCLDEALPAISIQLFSQGCKHASKDHVASGCTPEIVLLLKESESLHDAKK